MSDYKFAIHAKNLNKTYSKENNNNQSKHHFCPVTGCYKAFKEIKKLTWHLKRKTKCSKHA